MKKENQIRASHSREPNFMREHHWLQWSKCSLQEEGKYVFVDFEGSGEKDAPVQIREGKKASIKDRTENV